MKAVTVFEQGNIRTGVVYGITRAKVWQGISKTVKKTAERIVEAAIVVLIAAVFIAAFMRLHESCQTTAYFNEAIANTVITVANVN